MCGGKRTPLLPHTTTGRYSSYVRKNGDTVPAKLTEADMGLVADFVLEQAKAGWK